MEARVIDIKTKKIMKYIHEIRFTFKMPMKCLLSFPLMRSLLLSPNFQICWPII